MARYIDADLLIKELKELQGLHLSGLSKVANKAVDLGLSLSMRMAKKNPHNRPCKSYKMRKMQTQGNLRAILIH